MPNVKISKKLFERIETLASQKQLSIEDAIASKFEVPMQFDKTTKEGVLRRVFYYQRKRYGNMEHKTLKKFIKYWKSNKEFKRLWTDYKEYDYDKSLLPTFSRFGSDTQVEKLYVGTKSSMSLIKAQVEAGQYD